jgi:hypothetical protein
VLARVALQAAVHTRGDLLDLLNDPGSQRPPAKSTPIAAVALV